MNIEIFKKLGLTGNETIIYLALLELGSVSAGKIIKNTNLSRGQVYDCLNSLIKKGVISFNVQANKKYFEAVSPKSFQNLIDNKKNKLENIEKDLNKLIPILENKRKLGKEEQEVTLFKGKKGIKSLFEDCLQYKENISIIGAYNEDAKTLKYFMRYYLPNWHKRRIKMKIKAKFIFPSGSKLRAIQLAKLPLTEVKLLPIKFGSISATQIRGEKIDTVLWSSNPIGIIIRSKEVANQQQKYFDFLWRISKPLD